MTERDEPSEARHAGKYSCSMKRLSFAKAGCTWSAIAWRAAACRRSLSASAKSGGNDWNGAYSGLVVGSAPVNASNCAGTRAIASLGGIQPDCMPARISAVSCSNASGTAARRFR